MSRRGGPLSLQDLIVPVTAPDFIQKHLLAEKHLLASASPRLLAALEAIDEFNNLRELAQRFERVALLGPNGFRSSVPGASAMDFYERGDTLYLTNVERVLPGVARLFDPIARELGVQPKDLSIEVFAARNRAVSTLHYDNDMNFQVLLRGRKLWRLQRNAHVRSPLHSNHTLRVPRDEVFAEKLPFPVGVEDLEDPVEITSKAGTTLFLPLGYWHHAEMSEEAFAVNLVLHPLRWVDAVGRAARRLLVGVPALRVPVFGALGVAPGPLRDSASQSLRVAIAAYKRALDDLQLDDIALAADRTTMRWAGKYERRRLRKTPTGAALIFPAFTGDVVDIEADLVPLMRRLVKLRAPFGLQELKVLDPRLRVTSLLLLMLDLERMGYVEAVGA
jgi:hypothetical protein